MTSFIYWWRLFSHHGSFELRPASRTIDPGAVMCCFISDGLTTLGYYLSFLPALNHFDSDWKTRTSRTPTYITCDTILHRDACYFSLSSSTSFTSSKGTSLRSMSHKTFWYVLIRPSTAIFRNISLLQTSLPKKWAILYMMWKLPENEAICYTMHLMQMNSILIRIIMIVR